MWSREQFEFQDRVIKFVIDRHAGQMHGERAYVNHLAETVSTARRFLCADYDIIIACWLHDCLEDTDATEKDLIEYGVSDASIDIIKRVTDEPGVNRKERKAKTYPKIWRHYGATFVKLCDRIANVEVAISQRHHGFFHMYRNEHGGFSYGLRTGDKRLEPLWSELEALLARELDPR